MTIMKVKFFMPVLAVLFSLFTVSSLNAQVVCNGTSSCPPGATQIEITNNTNCDYWVTIEYNTGGTVSSVTCTIPAGGTGVACYNHKKTTIIGAEAAIIPSGQGVYLSNPGYPGAIDGPINGGGCSGSDGFLFENDGSTGPGHVTNLVIF